jgi:class 3 adenylate cyclase
VQAQLAKFLLLFFITIVSSSSWGDEPVVIINGSPNLHVELFDFLRKLPADYQVESPIQLTAGEWREKFAAVSRKESMVWGGGDKWYRLTLFNAESQNVRVALYNTLPVATLKVIHDAAPAKVYRLGYEEVEPTDTFNSHFSYLYLDIPPGRSHLYLAVSSPGKYDPVSLYFELRSEASFNSYSVIRMVLFSFWFGLAVLIFLVVFGLGLILKNRIILQYSLLVMFYCGIEAVLIGMGGSDFYGLSSNASMVWPTFLVLATLAVMIFCCDVFNVWPQPLLKWYVGMGALLPVSLFALYTDLLSLNQFLLSMVVITAGFFFLFNLQLYRNKYNIRLHLLFFVAFLSPLLAELVKIMIYTGMFQKSGHTMELATFLGGFINSSITLLAFGISISQIKTSRDLLRASLKTIVSQEHLETILKSKRMFDTKPVVKRITVLFIDIVGYSIILKRLLPHDAFHSMKELLNKLTVIIHKYNGVIDRSLGDGCLAFFGYDLIGGTFEGHEEKAVLCAMEIQQTIVGEINRHKESGLDLSQIYVLRIGINTDDVCIGNIGGENRFDFTISGSGVVLANRLENGCEPFKVNISENTWHGLSKGFKSDKSIYKRLIAIKHEQNLVQCYEVNPFDGCEEELESARKAFWLAIGINQRYQRYTPRQLDIVLDSDHGKMKLVNFSFGGYLLRSAVYLGKGVAFKMDMSTLFTAARPFDAVDSLEVEVVWGTPDDDDCYLLGVRINSLDDTRKKALFDALRDFYDERDRIPSGLNGPGAA